ncbi:MAG TPA: hypothetical protein VFM58_22205 [Solirubrobacteraceae bacterium]|nr:hypothetical protein [Solirubrobacteraceae bacterium]
MRALRLLALWSVLFAVFAAGVGIDARSGDELLHLRIEQALIHEARVVDTPAGVGFALLISPARELGGPRAVELFLAALAALGFVFSALLARRIVPEPYASAGAALAGLSAPAVAHGAAIYPEAVAGTLLAGAAVCALPAYEAPRVAPVVGGGALLAVLPWLGPLYVIPAVPIAVALYRWCRRGRRPLLGLVGVEIGAASLVTYATLNERLYGGPTPWSASRPGVTATGADTLADYVERVPRLLTLWVDPDVGLLRWAPIFALAFVGAWLLWRSRRAGLARALAERATAEAAATLALAIVTAQLLVAAFLVPAIDGDWFAARYLAPALPAAGALIAWSCRHAPRVAAALGAVSVLATVWVLADA